MAVSKSWGPVGGWWVSLQSEPHYWVSGARAPDFGISHIGPACPTTIVPRVLVFELMQDLYHRRYHSEWRETLLGARTGRESEGELGAATPRKVPAPPRHRRQWHVACRRRRRRRRRRFCWNCFLWPHRRVVQGSPLYQTNVEPEKWSVVDCCPL